MLESAIRPLLGAGESLRLATGLIADPGTTEDVSITDEAKNLLDPTMLLGGAHPGELGQRAVFGRAVVGEPGSLAQALFAAVAGVTSPALAVSDTRILIVDRDVVPRGISRWQRWFGPVDVVARLVYAVPRSELRGAVRAPKGALRRGRFLSAFSDGSVCALVCALPGEAENVVRELAPPAPRP